MKWLFLHELKLAWSRRADSLVALAFYMIVITLFPLGLGPEAGRVEQISSGSLWIALLLAVMLVMPSIYFRDVEDGTLEQWRSMEIALEMVVLAKLCALLVFLLLPLLLLTPMSAVMLGFPVVKLSYLALAIAIGAGALFCMGSVGAALMVVGNRQSSFMFMLLLLPLTIPVLIFGSAASWANAPFTDSFWLLLSFTLVMIPLSIWLSALLLRQVEL